LTYFETSAATGQNVSKAIECLLNKVMIRIEAAVDKGDLLGLRTGVQVGGSGGGSDVDIHSKDKSKCSC